MKDYELIIFDLDGTLLDTTQGILTSVKVAIELLKLQPLSHEDLLTFIGPPIQDSFSKYYGLTGQTLQDATNIFRDNYSTQYLFMAEPYFGIYDVLDYLSGNNIKSAVATYKREDYALELLKYFKIDKYTDIMFGADHENKLKKKDIIIKCLDKSGISDLKKVAVIGDTLHDAIGAENLDLDFIAVTYGFGFKNREKLSVKSVACIDKPLGIIDFLNQ